MVIAEDRMPTHATLSPPRQQSEEGTTVVGGKGQGALPGSEAWDALGQRQVSVRYIGQNCHAYSQESKHG